MMISSFAFRHALRVTLAVCVALLINHFYIHQAWLVITTFLVCQTTRGAPLRENLSYLIIMMTAVLLASLIKFYAPTVWIYHVVLAVIFAASYLMLFLLRPITYKKHLLIMLIAFVFLMLIPMPSANLQDTFFAVLIGGIIAIVFNLFVLPVKYYNEFKHGLTAVLQAMINFSETASKMFASQAPLVHSLNEQKNHLENTFVLQQDDYPEWVYEVGFNPGLRSGYRFFLLSLERVAELMLAMNYLLSTQIDAELKQSLGNALAASMHINTELLRVLLENFKYGQRREATIDYTSDITELDSTIQKIIPLNLALLDISHDYIALSALVRNIKDMRELLLQLVMALPEEKTV